MDQKVGIKSMQNPHCPPFLYKVEEDSKNVPIIQ